jgi:subfamily B ATP-binding cassette protein MsbA
MNQNLTNEAIPSARALIRALFLQPLLQQRQRLVWITGALLGLSFAQGGFLLLAGPLLKSFFELGATGGQLALAKLLPPQVENWWPAAADWVLPTSQLAWMLPMSLLVVGLIRSLATYAYHYHQQAVALQLAKSYRDRLFAAILGQPYEKLAQESAGRWMSLIMNDVMVLQSRFTDIVGGVIKDSMLVIACLLALYWVHWPTATVLLILCPVLGGSLGRSGRKISHFAEAWQRRLADMTAYLLSIRQRFAFIRAQGGEAFEAAQFETLNQSYFRMIQRSLPVRALLAPSAEFVGFVLFALMIYLVHAGIFFDEDLAGVVLIEFFAALGLIMRPLKNIGEQIARYQETKGTLLQSLRTFRDLQEQAQGGETPAGPASQPDRSLPTSLRLTSFSFGYGGQVAIRGTDLNLARGRAVAVIGPSGSGKSTLIKGLAGLLEPLAWQADEPWARVCRRTALVSQKPFLFDASLRDNLIYGLAQPPGDDVIWQALDRMGLRSLIEELPDRLATAVHSLHASFSGGQLQRLMVVRSLLRTSDLLLCDEATSAVDSHTEELMTRQLIDTAHQQQGMLIFITHRLRWLNQFDEIWFVENGEINWAGTYQSLLKVDRLRHYIGQS